MKIARWGRQGFVVRVAGLLALSLGGCESAPEAHVGATSSDLHGGRGAVNPHPAVSDFVIYATRSVRLGREAWIDGGSVGVALTAPTAFGPQLVVGDEVSIERDVGLFAPTIQLGRAVSVASVFTNALMQGVHDHVGTIATLPSNLPHASLAAIATPGATAIVVPRFHAETLAPGSYGDVSVDGALILSGGRYSFSSLTLGDHARLFSRAGDVDVRVARSLRTGRSSVITSLRGEEHQGYEDSRWFDDEFEDSDDCAHARAFVISVQGADQPSIAAAALGPASKTCALVNAPHGTLSLGEFSRVVGALSAFDVTIGDHSAIRFDTGFSASAAGQKGSQALAGYAASAAGAVLAGPVPPDQVIRIGVGLPHRNQAALDSFIHDVADPSSAIYRHFLSPTDFAASYGPTAADHQSVLDFAGAHGLAISRDFPSNAYVAIQGTAGAVGAAFYGDLNYYLRADGTQFYALDREPSLDLTATVLRISGLDNRVLGRALDGSGTNGNYNTTDLRTAYLGKDPTCAPLDGTGQIIGQVQIGDFLETDVTQYAHDSGLSAPDVRPISSNGTVAFLSTETTLDITMSFAMAPNAIILPVFSEGALSGMNASLNVLATPRSDLPHPLANQISSSWNGSADDNTTQAMKQFIAQGQAYFQASGDNGANAYINVVKDFSNLWTGDGIQFGTVVGGTVLTMDGTGLAYKSEATWPPSGGGTALGLPFPSYQTGFVTAANQASSVNRNVPDVSAVAQSVDIVYQGAHVGVGGTSASAPLWAGFAALINQRAASQGAPPLGFLNPALYRAAGFSPQLNASAFNDIKDGSQNNDDGSGMLTAGFSAVPGYDLATGLGTPRCGLVYALAGGTPPTPPTPPGPPPTAHVDLGITEEETGPKLCFSGATLFPNAHITTELSGIPGRSIDVSGPSGNVNPDGTLTDIAPFNSSYVLLSGCSAAQLAGTVTVTITESVMGATVGTFTQTVPADLWCPNGADTTFGSGCGP